MKTWTAGAYVVAVFLLAVSSCASDETDPDFGLDPGAPVTGGGGTPATVVGPDGTPVPANTAAASGGAEAGTGVSTGAATADNPAGCPPTIPLTGDLCPGNFIRCSYEQGNCTCLSSNTWLCSNVAPGSGGGSSTDPAPTSGGGTTAAQGTGGDSATEDPGEGGSDDVGGGGAEEGTAGDTGSEVAEGGGDGEEAGGAPSDDGTGGDEATGGAEATGGDEATGGNPPVVIDNPSDCPAAQPRFFEACSNYGLECTYESVQGIVYRCLCREAEQNWMCESV